MVELCKLLLAPAIWVALLLLVASSATRGAAPDSQIERCAIAGVTGEVPKVGAPR
jgi:hypothetical protein